MADCVALDLRVQYEHAHQVRFLILCSSLAEPFREEHMNKLRRQNVVFSEAFAAVKGLDALHTGFHRGGLPPTVPVYSSRCFRIPLEISACCREKPWQRQLK